MEQKLPSKLFEAVVIPGVDIDYDRLSNLHKMMAVERTLNELFPEEKFVSNYLESIKDGDVPSLREDIFTSKANCLRKFRVTYAKTGKIMVIMKIPLQ